MNDRSHESPNAHSPPVDGGSETEFYYCPATRDPSRRERGEVWVTVQPCLPPTPPHSATAPLVIAVAAKALERQFPMDKTIKTMSNTICEMFILRETSPIVQILSASWNFFSRGSSARRANVKVRF